MKKSLLIRLTSWVLLPVLLVLASCSTQVNPAPVYQADNWVVFTYEVVEGDWKRGDQYYFHNVAAPEITNYIYAYGVVQVYVYAPDAWGNEVQRPLPITQFYEVGSTPAYTETLDFDFTNGSLGLYVTYNDGSSYLFPSRGPGRRKFRIAIEVNGNMR